MLHPKRRRILKHVIANDVEIIKLGKQANNDTCPEQILLLFKKDDSLVELPGAEVFHGYGKNSVIMSYDSFRRLVVKVAVALSECDEEFNRLLADEDTEPPDGMFSES